MKIKIVLMFALLFLMLIFVDIGCADGIAPEEEWNKTFGGTDWGVVKSVQQTTDNGYILAGYTVPYSANSGDFWLMKTDSNGNEQWSKTFEDTDYNSAHLVQQTTDGGYILAGYTYSFESKYLLVKTDSNGIEQWNKTFGGTDDDSAYSVQQTTDDGYILAGETWSYGMGDFWLVKIDSNGNEQWNKTFGGTNTVQQTTDGGYILAGSTTSYGAGSNDFWLVKTDSNGNEQWNKTFGGTNRDVAYSVQQTIDGGFILVGKTESYGAGYDNSWLVKTDSNGNEQWSKTFIVWSFNEAYSVQQTTDGGYILIGSTCSYGAGEIDFWLVKTDSNGNEQWNKTFGGINEDFAYSVQQTADDGYILAGYTRSYGAGGSDFWLVKTDSNGNEQWNKTFGGTNDDSAYSVQQTTDDGYILAGETWPDDAGSIDFWLVKTDSNGNEQWNKTFGGTNGESAQSVKQTTDGGYILVGSKYMRPYGGSGIDFWLVKTDSNGNEQWNKTFGGTNGESAQSVKQTTDGGYILVGSTTSYGAGKRNYWLIKVSGENNDWKNEWVGEESEAGTTITTNELQDIIHHWLEDISVREHIMSISDLQEMINIWLSG